MPNHTSCLLRALGSKSDIEVFMKAAKKEHEILSLDALYPMPEEIRHVTNPVRIVSEEEYEAAVKQREVVLKKYEGKEIPLIESMNISLPLTKKLQKEYQDKFGADNWYDWAVKNWGTKWGLYKISPKWEIVKKGELMGELMEIQCHFQSAWSPPTEAFKAISKFAAYHMVKFILAYADEGGFFLGYSVIQDGGYKEVELPVKPWNGEAQQAFRRMCGQAVYEDEESVKTPRWDKFNAITALLTN